MATFLIDNCNTHLGLALRGHRVLWLGDVGLTEGASDGQIVDAARDRDAIVVSANKRDYRAEMQLRGARSGSQKVGCLDGRGVLVVSGELKDLNIADTTRRLRFKGARIDWDDVSDYNLQVSVGKGSVVVGELARCVVCAREHPFAEDSPCRDCRRRARRKAS